MWTVYQKAIMIRKEHLKIRNVKFKRAFVCCGAGQVRAPYHTNVCKVLRLCGAISSLSLDVSPLNLVSYLVFKALLQQCRWIFAYCSLSKLVRIYYAASVSEKMTEEVVLSRNSFIDG